VLPDKVLLDPSVIENPVAGHNITLRYVAGEGVVGATRDARSSLIPGAMLPARLLLELEEGEYLSPSYY
jgi:hypothetical protein